MEAIVVKYAAKHEVLLPQEYHLINGRSLAAGRSAKGLTEKGENARTPGRRRNYYPSIWPLMKLL